MRLRTAWCQVRYSPSPTILRLIITPEYQSVLRLEWIIKILRVFSLSSPNTISNMIHQFCLFRFASFCFPNPRIRYVYTYSFSHPHFALSFEYIKTPPMISQKQPYFPESQSCTSNTSSACIFCPKPICMHHQVPPNLGFDFLCFFYSCLVGDCIVFWGCT